MLGPIKRNFIFNRRGICNIIDVRYHLEQAHANSVWNPHRQGLIKDPEKVQMRVTKMVLTVKHSTYKERLRQLNLPTVKCRCTRGDIMEVLKKNINRQI